jgi:hypothetical protein
VREQARQEITAGVRDSGEAARSTDCAHLHSAFGPGCPYCWEPASGTAGRREPPSLPLGDQAAAA